MSEQAERYTSIDLDWMFCREKRAFRSKAKAHQYMLRNVHRYGRQTPYRCGACQKWHLTSRYYRK